MKFETRLNTQKTALRKHIRQQRRTLNSSNQLAMDQAIGCHVEALIKQSQARRVAAFWSFDGEPDLIPTLELLERSGIELALPVILQSSGEANMKFRKWSNTAAMENNRYGIPEPVATIEIGLEDIDLILIPLVGWDNTGGRLGMGAGYYDRALWPFIKSPRPVRVGIAYDLQKIPRLPLDPWDIPLHMVISESGLHAASPSN